MAEMKTKTTGVDVETFLAAIEPVARREDARTLAAIMTEIAGEPAAMWGPSIIGFGHYHYRYDSGREGDMCRIGFSPRKAALTLYLTSGYPMRDDLLARLGKHSKGKGCLYIKRLADIDEGVLRDLVTGSLADNRARYPEEKS